MTNSKLTQTQIQLLRVGADREDRYVAAPNGWAASEKKSAVKMIEGGWLKEIKAKPGAPIWRKDGARGTSYSLKLTAAGVKAAALNGVKAEEAAAGATRKLEQIQPDPDLVKPASNPEAQAEKAVEQQRSFREGTKLAEVLKLLQRDGGVTVDELSSAMDWLPHSTRAVLTGLRKRGIELGRRKSEDRGVSSYFVNVDRAGVSERA